MIKVAIIGVGNCAKSLVEGVSFYSDDENGTHGLMHPSLGPYAVSDITFVAAFDVDERKVSLPLHKAIASEPNNTMALALPKKYDVLVQRGPTLDGIIPESREWQIHESTLPPVDVADVLVRSKAELVINYLPTGSDEATVFYADAALSAGCGFVNCMPTPIARDPLWRKRFTEKKLPLLGDDIKSQLGATILNRVLLNLFGMRGITLASSAQVNYGGNADHFNLSYRAASKERTKLSALQSVSRWSEDVISATMVYTAENFDHKMAEITLKGTAFGGAPVSLRLVLDDEDSPNSAGVVVDAIRAARLLKDARMCDRAADISSCLMKASPRYMSEEESLTLFDSIVRAAEINASAPS